MVFAFLNRAIAVGAHTMSIRDAQSPDLCVHEYAMRPGCR